MSRLRVLRTGLKRLAASREEPPSVVELVDGSVVASAEIEEHVEVAPALQAVKGVRATRPVAMLALRWASERPPVPRFRNDDLSV